jgi:hypothetical protein
MKSSSGTPSILVLAVAVTAATLLSLPAWGSTRYRILHNFNSGEQYQIGPPGGPLLLDEQGNVYGGTGAGGVGCGGFGCGTIFELSPRADGHWRFTVLYEFLAGDDGESPWGALIFDQAGNLYGTTERDGGLGPSTAFELSPGPDGWTHTVLYDNGAGPGLLLDKAGNLYGSIGPGDYYSAGAIGELSPGENGWTYTQLYSFCSQNDCADGMGPPSAPIWDAHGNLFGTTNSGGKGQEECLYGCGVVFEMTPKPDGSWRYHVLHRFDSSPDDGRAPGGGLVMDAEGNLYGETRTGGHYGNGTIYEMSETGGRWKKTALYDFPDCFIGCNPFGTLVFDTAGNLYGAGNGGNPDCGNGCGVVFKLTRQKNGKWKYGTVHKFDGTDGYGPWGVIVDGKGNIFGTTENGWKYDWGVAYEITP